MTKVDNKIAKLDKNFTNNYFTNWNAFHKPQKPRNIEKHKKEFSRTFLRNNSIEDVLNMPRLIHIYLVGENFLRKIIGNFQKVLDMLLTTSEGIYNIEWKKQRNQHW